MSDTPKRPPFILSSKDVAEKSAQYPDSSELLAYGRAIGKAAGLLRIGLHIERVPPGHRTSAQRQLHSCLSDNYISPLPGRPFVEGP